MGGVYTFHKNQVILRLYHKFISCLIKIIFKAIWNTASDNLKASVAGETHEYTDMYPGMAKAARDEGFDEIADWMETLAKAERSHANRFQKALDTLDA